MAGQSGKAEKTPLAEKCDNQRLTVLMLEKLEVWSNKEPL